MTCTVSKVGTLDSSFTLADVTALISMGCSTMCTGHIDMYVYLLAPISPAISHETACPRAGMM